MLIVKGIEITLWFDVDTPKHVLALFLEEEIPYSKYIVYNKNGEVAGLFDLIHQYGGLGVVAHPAADRGDQWGEWSKYRSNYYTKYWIDAWEFRLGHQESKDWMLSSDETVLLNHDFHSVSSDSMLRFITNTCTLLLCHNRTIAGLREAVESGRTVLYFYNRYYGHPDVLAELILAEEITSVASIKK